ncbi:MAG: ATP-binding cassette domain-containing protein [Chloroflexia bacterium]
MVSAPASVGDGGGVDVGTGVRRWVGAGLGVRIAVRTTDVRVGVVCGELRRRVYPVVWPQLLPEYGAAKHPSRPSATGRGLGWWASVGSVVMLHPANSTARDSSTVSFARTTRGPPFQVRSPKSITRRCTVYLWAAKSDAFPPSKATGRMGADAPCGPFSASVGDAISAGRVRTLDRILRGRMPAIIEVRDLEKRFKLSKRRPGPLGAVRGLFSTGGREVAAVEHLDFEVHAGEMVGYIGPNGAGKSTTIKMLTGILVPTSGDVRVDGLVPWRHRARLASRIGVVFGQRTQLWWDLPLIESLQLLRHIYRVPKDRFERCLVTLVETLDIGDFLEKPVRQPRPADARRPRGLASPRPSILYLDEPTIGLDVVAKEIRTFYWTSTAGRV